MRFEHSLEMAASASTVWRLTTDVEQWPALFPTVTSVKREGLRSEGDGEFGVGSTAMIKQPGQKATRWTVTVFEPETRFEWEASVYGVRTIARHLVEPTATGARNTLILELSGRGSKLMGRLVGRKLLTVLATENDGFRRAAEAHATAS